jgi:hypothetical protein
VPEWQIKTRFKLKPGQRGTKKLLDQYGDALVCVRYRYDLEKRKQFKTIEIIVSESDWIPTPPKYANSDLVALRIGYEEKNLQEQARSLGGKWDRQQKVWLIRYGCIAGTAMEKLIVLETMDNN